MTEHLLTVACIALLKYVVGPAVIAWVTAKVNAKPKRKRNTSRKTTR